MCGRCRVIRFFDLDVWIRPPANHQEETEDLRPVVSYLPPLGSFQRCRRQVLFASDDDERRPDGQCAEADRGLRNMLGARPSLRSNQALTEKKPMPKEIAFSLLFALASCSKPSDGIHVVERRAIQLTASSVPR